MEGKHYLPPVGGQVFEYYYDFQLLLWNKWSDNNFVSAFRLNHDAPFSSILVPTSDNASRLYLLDMFVHNEKPVMLYGPTGVGKTLEISQFIFNGLEKSLAPLKLIFSLSVTAAELQEIMESNFEYLQRIGWIPTLAKKLVAFLDNIATPQPGKTYTGSI
jgi:hypothetical protein